MNNGRKTGEGKLTGNLKKFDEIPDGISNFSQASKQPQKRFKKKQVEKELTDKPNNLVLNQGDNTSVSVGLTLSRKKKKEQLVSEKPNEIREQIHKRL